MGGPIDPRPKGMSTGLKVLLIFGAILGVGALTCGAGALWLSRQPAFREMFDAARQAENHPSAVELRAAGCTGAAVLDMAATMDAIRNLAAESDEDLEDVPRYQVSCTLGSTPITCDEVARIFLAATPEPGVFTASVVTEAGHVRCSQTYAADGSDQSAL